MIAPGPYLPKVRSGMGAVSWDILEKTLPLTIHTILHCLTLPKLMLNGLRIQFWVSNQHTPAILQVIDLPFYRY